MMGRPKQGVALMIVLVLLAVMTSLAASLSSGLQSQITLAHTQQVYQQAFWYAAGAESLTLSTLSQRRERLYSGKNGGLESVLYPVEQGNIRMTIRDMQTCFNVNALATPDLTSGSLFRVQLVRLLTLLGLPLSRAESLAEQLRQHVNGEMISQSSSLSGMPPPLSPGGGWLMTDLSELRQFREVDTELYRKLEPFLCTLPITKLAINMNTLSPEKSVLLAAIFSPFLNTDQVRDVLRKRPVQGWESVDHFLEALPADMDVKSVQSIKPFLQIESDYLQLHTLVHMNTLSLNMQSLITRSGEQPWTIMWHQMGELQ